MDDFITSQTLADELGLKPQTLRRWRSEGRGPRFIRFGDARRGRVRYSRQDVAEWIAEAITSPVPRNGHVSARPQGSEVA